MGSEALSSVERSLADDQITKMNAPAPSICVFDVNETLLDMEFIAPLFQRLFGDRKVLREWFQLR
jgi:2-haloacid dehalogenase